MNILIVENEKPAADKLSRLLVGSGREVRVAGTTETVEGTVNWLLSNPPPDLIMMDIQLDDGLCFEIFDTVKIVTPVIFTTAYDEYALRAFRVNSVDYLLKPLEQKAVDAALDKFETYHHEQYDANIRNLLMEFTRRYRNRFLIRTGTRFKSIQVRDIMLFHILERCTFLRTMNGREYDLDISLDGLQRSLDPDIFFRINRDCLINIEAISDITGYSSSRLLIRLSDPAASFGEDLLVVSREKVQEFKRWIDK